MIMLRLRDVVEPEDAERDLVTVAGGSSGTRSARRPELMVTLAPAGLETFFAEVGSPVGPGERKPTEMTIDVEEVNRRGERHGVEFVGPPQTLDD
jgi:hypothetical protein